MISLSTPDRLFFSLKSIQLNLVISRQIGLSSLPDTRVKPREHDGDVTFVALGKNRIGKIFTRASVGSSGEWPVGEISILGKVFLPKRKS